MAVGFPPNPAFPLALDSDRTLFLVYNTSESKTTSDNAPWQEVVEIDPVGPDDPEVWADNGFANISGELFYYDSVEKDGNGKVFRLKRCARSIGGKATRFNPKGTWVRGFVIAEHHNQLVDAVVATEGYILGVEESLNLLDAEPECVDDAPCVDVQLDVSVVEDQSTSPNCSGTTISYTAVINGTFDSFVLNFGDGQSTSSSLNGTHTYSPGASIDPVITVVSELCTVVQTPIDRDTSDVPEEPVVGTPVLVIPEVPDFPEIIIPDLQDPGSQIELPQIVFPCLDVLPDIGIPSVISIVPPEISIVPPDFNPIPSVITFGPVPTIPMTFTFGPAPTVEPASFVFGPAPTVDPASFVFGPAPAIEPASFTFGPAPAIEPVSFVFGPAPSIEPASFVFGPAPSIEPVQFTFGPAPTIPPVSFAFGPAPTIPPVSFTFGPAPTIPPVQFTFGPAPTVQPVQFTFGPAPAIRPVSFAFGPAPTVQPVSFSFGPAPAVQPVSFTFGPAPTIQPVSFSFGPAPKIDPVSFSFGPAPKIDPVSFSFGPAPKIDPVSFSFGPAPSLETGPFTFGPAPNINSSFTWGTPPRASGSFTWGAAPSITGSFSWGDPPSVSASVEWGYAPNIVASVEWSSPQISAISVEWGEVPQIRASVEWGSAPEISVNWGSAPTISCVVAVECPSPGSSAGFRRNMTLDDNFVDDFNTDDFEIEIGDLGIPSEIKIVAPKIPDIHVRHDIPSFIDIKSDIPSRITVYQADVMPKEIRVIADSIPRAIAVDASSLPESIRIDAGSIPGFISLIAPDMPSVIRVEGYRIPESISITGIPDSIEVKMPSEIVARLEVPENLEVPLVYRGGPVPVQFDSSSLAADGEQVCFALVPCGKK